MGTEEMPEEQQIVLVAPARQITVQNKPLSPLVNFKAILSEFILQTDEQDELDDYQTEPFLHPLYQAISKLTESK